MAKLLPEWEVVLTCGGSHFAHTMRALTAAEAVCAATQEEIRVSGFGVVGCITLFSVHRID